MYPSEGCDKSVKEFTLTYSITRVQAYQKMHLTGFITKYPQHYYHYLSGYALGIIVLRLFVINP